MKKIIMTIFAVAIFSAAVNANDAMDSLPKPEDRLIKCIKACMDLGGLDGPTCGAACSLVISSTPDS